MYESYGTYVNDEYVENHEYDDDTDDNNDHKKDSNTAAGAAPTQIRPGHARPSQTPKILFFQFFILTLWTLINHLLTLEVGPGNHADR